VQVSAADARGGHLDYDITRACLGRLRIIEPQIAGTVDHCDLHHHIPLRRTALRMRRSNC
jgi:hypothetical protein